VTPTVERQLDDGLSALPLDLPHDARDKLLRYLALLQKWNRTYNLTAIREPARLVSHHLLDCLTAIPHIPPGRTVDIGSGGGLPGVPLAIAQPERAVALLDSNHKKGAFLKQVVIECGLRNAEVHVGRAEEWAPAARFEVGVSRAFADLPGFVEAARHLVQKEGLLGAMKGLHPDEELAQLPPGVAVHQTIPLSVPGLKAARHLILLRLLGTRT
jgi:16S rRNA (guanine527-N7)-methyltransferase